MDVGCPCHLTPLVVAGALFCANIQNMIDDSLGRVVWQERPAKFIFVARKDRRMFTFEEISAIKAEMRKRRKDDEQRL